jgi:hypothetical protein
MKAKGLSVLIVIATLSCAAVAVAQQPDPADEPDAAPSPSGDDAPPESGAPSDAPPVEAAPVPPAPAAAPPDADATLGSVGQIAISDDLEMTATRESTAGQSSSRTEIALRPALDFFPLANLSVGAQLIIGYISNDEVGGSTTSSALGLLVRIGYIVSISDTVSIWPRLSLGYDHIGADVTGSLDRVPIQVFVPIVVQPAPHFFIGGGPFYRTTILSQRENFDEPRTSILGLQATLGGYFRGL